MLNYSLTGCIPLVSFNVGLETFKNTNRVKRRGQLIPLTLIVKTNEGDMHIHDLAGGEALRLVIDGPYSVA